MQPILVFTAVFVNDAPQKRAVSGVNAPFSTAGNSVFPVRLGYARLYSDPSVPGVRPRFPPPESLIDQRMSILPAIVLRNIRGNPTSVSAVV